MKLGASHSQRLIHRVPLIQWRLYELFKLTKSIHSFPLRFKVEYYKDDGGKVSDGEIMMIRPRGPCKGDQSEVKTWEEFGFNLELNDWGNSPYLTKEEVDELTFCCCECCNKKSCLSGLSELLCDRFPNISTANQFFTPLQFSAYHREGYRACVEAQAAEFLMEDHDVQEV